MDKNIAIVFDGKIYKVCVNDEVVATEEKMAEAYKLFEKTVNNNIQAADTSWDYIKDAIEALNPEGVTVYEVYQAIEYKDVKYFHQTGKLYYTGSGEMLPLVGGPRLLQFIVSVVAKKQLEASDDLVELCVQATKIGVNYRVKESSFTLASPIFNYGSISYNFQTKEMHKGTAIENITFEDFKSYVLGTIC